MAGRARLISLTAEHVARVHREIPNPGPDAQFGYPSDDDYLQHLRMVLSRHEAGRDAWIFAYGSLIWKPAVDHAEERIGTARGWHRSFRMRLTRGRGTHAQPGLMLGLDRGGQCRGVLYRIAGDVLEAQIERLLRRELPIKTLKGEPTYLARWLHVDTTGPGGEPERVRALAFVLNRRGFNYSGKLTQEEIADHLAVACGYLGSGAEYLLNTVAHLEERGIHDRGLWQLQEMVAQRIAARGQE